MSRILLLEDDRSLGQTLKERLSLEGYEVQLFQTIEAAEQGLKQFQFDVAVLDVGLPDGSGFEFAKKIRQQTAMPFLFMTAASDAENRLQGFELGAEEFIPKPFHLKELLIRVKHVLHSHVPEKIIDVEGVSIDFDRLQVTSATGEVKKLASKEFQLLKFLIESSPKVVSREDLLNRIWGEEQFPSTRTVDNVVLRVRQSLGDRAGLWVRSIRGVGYQWIEPGGGNHGE